MDYQQEWDKFRQYTQIPQKVREEMPQEQAAQVKPHPQFSHFAWVGERRMQALGSYNELILRWQRLAPHFAENLRHILMLCATPDYRRRPPERVVVTNLFAKILKPTRKEKAEESMDRTIAFREYAQLEGPIALAFNVAEEWSQDLTMLLVQINYFGKRGCLFQLMGCHSWWANYLRDSSLWMGFTSSITK